ncbi:hypothetical protein OG985_18865 [Streptomyces sp. NBC_00289]|uniref:hypothetical protein n=1 Tax=Streptomyces sp. NBC_00289 TaxID=2975703 RepID=UPI003251824C
MADERCVFPGGTPRTPGRWLDRETAERLLSGEALDNAVDGAARDEAELLAKTLGSLSVETQLTSTELPGEAAALAAFRKAREAREGRAGSEGRAGHGAHGDRDAEQAVGGHRARPHGSDAGLVRIGGPDRRARRPRWDRPVRLGLTAALAAGMVGGVAVAAGTGILPTPFRPAEPAPAASVSAAVTPDHPPVSPSPKAPGKEPTPGGSAPSGSAGSPGQDSPRDTARAGSSPGDTAGPGRTERDGRWSGAASACRDVHDGKELTRERRRALESVAGGSARVYKYCKGVLAVAPDNGTESQNGETGHDGRNDGGGDGKGDGDGTDQGNEDGDGRGGHTGDDDGNHLSPGHGHGHGGHGDGRDRSGDGSDSGDGGDSGDEGNGGGDTPTAAAPLLPTSTTWQSPSPTAPYHAL